MDNLISEIRWVLIKNPENIQKLRGFLRSHFAGGVFDQPSISIFKATRVMLKAKKKANKSPRYRKALKGYLNQFMRGRKQMLIKDIDVKVLDGWFDGRDEMPATKATGINRLSTLFSFCVRRGWCPKNPCNSLEEVTIDHRPPRFCTPKEADALIADCPSRSMAWLVLGMFCGLRPEAEVENLPRENIDLDNRCVRICW